MFVRDFVDVPLPYAQIAAHLMDEGGAILAPLADAAYGEGEELLVRVGPRGAGSALSRSVRLTTGIPYHRNDTSVLPIFWVAASSASLFASLEADLIISPMGDTTRIALDGSYRPPLGPLGRTVDRMLMHRVAEATIRCFLQRLRAELCKEITVVARPGSRAAQSV